MNENRPEPIPTCGPLAVVWALLAALIRLVPHPPNFAAMNALSLYSGARLPWYIGLGLPIVVMMSTDLVIWYTTHLRPFNWLVYACYLATAAMGLLLRRTNSVWKIGLAAVAGDVLFFFVTNYGAWLASRGIDYENSWAGLQDSYTRALPFHQWTVISTLLFVPIFFGVHAWAVKRVPATERA